MKYGDTCKRKAAELTGGHTMYHLINAAGIPYTTVEEADGFEIYSCERQNEKIMLKVKNLKVVRSYSGDDLINLADVIQYYHTHLERKD